MSINVFLIICVFILIGIISPKYRKKNKIQYTIIFIMFFLVAALRGNGDGDYFVYIERGQYLHNWKDVLNANVGMEIGYRILAYTIKLLHFPRQTIIIAMNAISFWCLNKFIKKYSSHWLLSLLVFLPIFFQFEMHAARTGVAIAIVSYGYQYIEKRDLLKYILIVLLASGFHQTAWIAIIFYFLYDRDISLQNGIVIIALDIIAVKVLNITNIVMTILENIGLSGFLAKFDTYASSDRFGYSLNIFDPRILIGIVVFTVAMLFLKNKSEFDKFMINSTLCYSFIMILFSEHTFISYRLSSYFYYPIIALVPRIFDEGDFSRNDSRVKIIVFYITVMCFTILDMVYASTDIEYIFFWNNGQAILPWN